ncbi:NADPH-dependent FMN reductase [Nocardioides daphniae]|uniref:NADPH-dependent FMN reductase n=1 Tax=Nocardioides daphniae TaxID=402297 RepID=UPI001E3925D1|nr:NADPH-dependent FMN reductase [Nocardioides daphniae]
MTVKIGYLVGSLSSISINRATFEAVRKNAPEGVEITEISIADLPLYSQDHDHDFPEVARQLKSAIEAADAVVVATPTFNDSFSGVAKNAIDWASRPWGQHSFNGKPVAVAGSSIAPHGGTPGTTAMAAVLAFGEAKVLETPFNLNVTETTFTPDGDFADDEVRAEAKAFIAALAGNAAV